MQKKPRLALLIASGFGLGYLPKAPGTFGALLGILVFYGFMWVAMICTFLAGGPHGGREDVFWSAQLAQTFLLASLGAWAANRVHRYLSQKDPSIVVVDEISGQQITYLILLLPPFVDEFLNWKYILAGFILFRIFDIWKPWPVRAAEKLPGGWGIMADDWVAGLYAAICLWGLRAAGL